MLRTPATYDYHCSLLSLSLAEADSVTYGINYNSVLNKLEDFHVCNGQLPQDIMHILLEGSIPYTMKLMLKSFICTKNYFTITDINERILCFKYSRNECQSKPGKAPPNFIHDEGSIRQSGMYECCIYLLTLRLLPII